MPRMPPAKLEEVHHEQAQLKSEVVAVGFARVPARRLLVPLGGAALALDHAVNERHDDQRGVETRRPTKGRQIRRRCTGTWRRGTTRRVFRRRTSLRARNRSRQRRKAHELVARDPRDEFLDSRFSVAPPEIRQRRARAPQPWRTARPTLGSRSAVGRRSQSASLGPSRWRTRPAAGAARLPAATGSAAALPVRERARDAARAGSARRRTCRRPTCSSSTRRRPPTRTSACSLGSGRRSGPSRCRRTSARCGARASASTASRCASCRTRRSASSCATRTRGGCASSARRRTTCSASSRCASTLRACARRTRRSTSTS